MTQSQKNGDAGKPFVGVPPITSGGSGGRAVNRRRRMAYFFLPALR
jgi:hypothetical protein